MIRDYRLTVIIIFMITHPAVITELVQINQEDCVRLEVRNLPDPKPGQFLRAYGIDGDELLPTLLFPCGDSGLFCGDIPRHWLPGGVIHLRGPRGNGFHLLPLARKIALMTFDAIGVNRLLPLASQALSMGGEVTLLSSLPLNGLAPEIELLPMDELNHILNWADYLAVVLLPESIVHVNQILSPVFNRSRPVQVEVMLHAPMICDENSTCGVCGIPTTHGWKLACKDGPVFRLDELV